MSCCHFTHLSETLTCQSVPCEEHHQSDLYRGCGLLYYHWFRVTGTLMHQAVHSEELDLYRECGLLYYHWFHVTGTLTHQTVLSEEHHESDLYRGCGLL